MTNKHVKVHLRIIGGIQRTFLSLLVVLHKAPHAIAGCTYTTVERYAVYEVYIGYNYGKYVGR